MKARLLSAVLMLVSLCAGAVSAEPIGSVIALQGEVKATGSDGAIRVLAVKAEVFQNDKIATGNGAKIQMQFDDGTIISQGEKSEMTIDEYVYAPDKKEDNSCSVKIVSGAFKVMTGKITKLNPDRFKVRTKMATIGIRGCDLGFSISATGEENVYIIQLHGSESVTIETKAEAKGLITGLIGVKWDEKTEKKLLNVLRSGMVVSITENGVSAREMTADELANLIQTVTPQGGTTGDGTGDGKGDGTGDDTGDGTDDGTDDGTGEGTEDGKDDGTGDGTDDGTGDGTGDGSRDGTGDGTGEGTEDGMDDGTDDGMGDGTGDGSGDGTGDGTGDSTGDASDETATDTTGDTTGDAGEDTTDLAGDAPVDTTTDGTDASTAGDTDDLGGDVGTDATDDTMADTTTDAGGDATVDATGNAVGDTTTDLGGDTVVDSTGDTLGDTTTDLGTDTAGDLDIDTTILPGDSTTTVGSDLLGGSDLVTSGGTYQPPVEVPPAPSPDVDASTTVPTDATPTDTTPTDTTPTDTTPTDTTPTDTTPTDTTSGGDTSGGTSPPQEQPPPASSPVFTSMGSGTDWSWGIWETDGALTSVEFSGTQVSASDFQTIAAGAMLYNLSGSGNAAAIISHGGSKELVDGSCSLGVQVGQNVNPTWDGSFNMSGTDASLSFSAVGNIQNDGLMTGNEYSYSMQVHGVSFDRGSITSEKIEGHLVGPGSGATPITGAVGSFDFSHGSSATVRGGFGANLR